MQLASQSFLLVTFNLVTYNIVTSAIPLPFLYLMLVAINKLYPSVVVFCKSSEIKVYGYLMNE